MSTIRFNHLPLKLKKSLVFPHSKKVSSNENDSFRIVFYSYNDLLFEVCYCVASNKIEDIRCINEKYLDPSLKNMILRDY